MYLVGWSLESKVTALLSVSSLAAKPWWQYSNEYVLVTNIPKLSDWIPPVRAGAPPVRGGQEVTVLLMSGGWECSCQGMLVTKGYLTRPLTRPLSVGSSVWWHTTINIPQQALHKHSDKRFIDAETGQPIKHRKSRKGRSKQRPQNARKSINPSFLKRQPFLPALSYVSVITSMKFADQFQNSNQRVCNGRLHALRTMINRLIIRFSSQTGGNHRCLLYTLPVTTALCIVRWKWPPPARAPNTAPPVYPAGTLKSFIPADAGNSRIVSQSYMPLTDWLYATQNTCYTY